MGGLACCCVGGLADCSGEGEGPLAVAGSSIDDTVLLAGGVADLVVGLVAE